MTSQQMRLKRQQGKTGSRAWKSRLQPVALVASRASARQPSRRGCWWGAHLGRLQQTHRRQRRRGSRGGEGFRGGEQGGAGRSGRHRPGLGTVPPSPSGAPLTGRPGVGHQIALDDGRNSFHVPSSPGIPSPAARSPFRLSSANCPGPPSPPPRATHPASSRPKCGPPTGGSACVVGAVSPIILAPFDRNRIQP
jgi:hypothetical protein